MHSDTVSYVDRVGSSNMSRAALYFDENLKLVNNSEFIGLNSF